MTQKISGIDIHTYLVKDPARAIAFWRDTMGLAATWESERGAEFELPDGATFGIWQMDDESWQPGNGIMFAVPDVREAAQEYRKKRRCDRRTRRGVTGVFHGVRAGQRGQLVHLAPTQNLRVDESALSRGLESRADADAFGLGALG